MKKIWILPLACFFLFGCAAASKEVKKSETQLQKKPVKSVMVADIPGATPNSVIVNTNWVDKKNLSVDFLAYKIDIEPVFGLAINLNYNSEVLKYLSYDKGSFFEQGGKPTGNQKPIYLVSTAGNKSKEKESGEKRLIIGATLFRGTPGVIGSGKLLSLSFKVKKNIPTEIVFTKKKLKNLQAKDISSINWPTSIPIPVFPDAN